MKNIKLPRYFLIGAIALLAGFGASHISTASAAPTGSAFLLENLPTNVTPIRARVRARYSQRYYRVHRRSSWVAPAIALGVFGAIAGANANQYYYGPAPYRYYYQAPPYGYYYNPQPQRRCFVTTDPVMLRGYWTWC